MADIGYFDSQFFGCIGWFIFNFLKVVKMLKILRGKRVKSNHFEWKILNKEVRVFPGPGMLEHGKLKE